MKEFRSTMGIIGVKEVAEYLGLAEVTIYRLLAKREIPAKKIGGQWRFMKEDVDRWFRDRR